MPNELIYPITRQAYEERPEVRQSALKAIAQSPAHFLHRMTNPVDPTPAMALGTYYDHLLFNTECQFEVCPFDNYRKDVAREWKSDRISKGITIISQEDNAIAQAMIRKIRAHPDAVDLLSAGVAQVGAFVEYPMGDVAVGYKGLLDWLPTSKAVVVDLKTTDDASLDAFQKKILSMDYHVQAAAYSRALEIVTAQKFDFAWIVVETEPPHECAVYIADQDILEFGRIEFEKRLAVYARCLERNDWPAYTGKQRISLPHWAQRRMEYL